VLVAAHRSQVDGGWCERGILVPSTELELGLRVNLAGGRRPDTVSSRRMGISFAASVGTVDRRSRYPAHPAGLLQAPYMSLSPPEALGSGGAPRPVVGAAPGATGRAGEGRIDTRATRAGTAVRVAVSGEGAAREPAERDDRPAVARDVGDVPARLPHRHPARAHRLALGKTQPHRRVGGEWAAPCRAYGFEGEVRDGGTERRPGGRGGGRGGRRRAARRGRAGRGRCRAGRGGGRGGRGGRRADALHARDRGRDAARTQGARRPVVGAARSSRHRHTSRTDDRRIGPRAVGAAPPAGSAGAEEVAAQEAHDVDDGPVIASVANERDRAARRLHGHHAPANPLRHDAAGPYRRSERGAIRARDCEVEVEGPRWAGRRWRRDRGSRRRGRRRRGRRRRRRGGRRAGRWDRGGGRDRGARRTRLNRAGRWSGRSGSGSGGSGGGGGRRGGRRDRRRGGGRGRARPLAR